MQYSAEEVITIIENWDEKTKTFFYRQLSINLTISTRVLFEDKTVDKEEILKTLKLINEFHHRVLTWFVPGGEQEPKNAAKLMGMLKHFADQLERRGAIEFPLASAFETTTAKFQRDNN